MKRRAISERMMQDFLSGELLPLLEAVQQDDTLCMELRGDSVNIYYRGGSLFQITQKTHGYGIWFDPKYCVRSALPGEPSVQDAAAQIPLYKREMDLWFHLNPKYEREFQQSMVRTNNRSGRISNATDYYIADIEFAETDGMNARFDMVALKWLSEGPVRSDPRKPSLAFLEVKYGDRSLDGEAGIEKHLRDWDAFIRDPGRLEALAQDMTEVFHQKCRLGLVDGLQETQYGLTISPCDPEVIFVFAEHDPASSVLKRTLSALRPADYPFPVLVASASRMGCGLYADGMETVEEFLQKEGVR